MAPSPRIPASPNGTHRDEHHNEDDGVLVSRTPTPEAGLSTADPIAVDSDDTSIEESPASDVTTDTSGNRVSKSFRRTRDEWQELRGMLETSVYLHELLRLAIILCLDQIQDYESDAMTPLLSRDFPAWRQAFSDYLQSKATSGSQDDVDEFTFSFLSSMAKLFGEDIEMDWLNRPFKCTHSSLDPTLADLLGYLCRVFGFTLDRPRLPAMSLEADLNLTLDRLGLRGPGALSYSHRVIRDVVHRLHFGNFLSVKDALPPGLFNQLGMKTLAGVCCFLRTARHLPYDVQERALHALYFIVADPFGLFAHSKPALNRWACSREGQAWEAWSRSTFLNAHDLEAVARRVFVWASVEAFSSATDRVERESSPLEDFFLLVSGKTMNNKRRLLEALVIATRGYVHHVQEPADWWYEIQDAFLNCAVSPLPEWSASEGWLSVLLSKIHRHAMTPRDAFLETLREMQGVILGLQNGVVGERFRMYIALAAR